jgi:hypothetical protein
MELQFEWDQVAAFVRQPDGSLFSWRERYCCFRYLIYGIVSVYLSSHIANRLVVPAMSKHLIMPNECVCPIFLYFGHGSNSIVLFQ